ncbi:hypothetical protein [Flavobacterium koreense]
MIETLGNFVGLILDKSKRWKYKVAIIISFISIVFIIDFVFKISYNHYLSNKLENLEKIQVLKKEYASNKNKLTKLLVIENEIFYETHYSDYLKIENLSISNLFEKKNPSKIKNKEVNVVDIRSYILMFISSSAVFIIIIISLIFMIFKEGKNLKSTLNWFSTLIVFLILSIIATWFAYQIPIILGLPILNYIMNFIIHCCFIYFIMKLNNKFNIN